MKIVKNLKFVIIAVVCIALVAFYYHYLSNRTIEESGETTKETIVEQTLDVDLSTDYPKTPRSVMKLYNEILECYYNESYSEEQLNDLVDLQRGLLDDELLAENGRDDYVINLRKEIEQFDNEKKTISSITISNTDEVVYKVIDGRETAYVTSSYFMKVDTSYERTYQRYVFRKSEDGQWKILVFYVVEGENDE